MKLVIAALILACPASALAQKLAVRIVDRKDNVTDYTYVVPSHFSSESDSTASCNGNLNTVDCKGSTTTNGEITPSHQVSFHVRGATFSLLLPDGRVAVVDCESKFAEHWRVLPGITGVAANRSWTTSKLSFMVTTQNWSGSSA